MRGCARLGAFARLHDLHQRDALAERGRGPARLRHGLGGTEPGLFPKLAHHAALQIDRVAIKIVAVGRARGEIDLPGGRGVRTHHAEQESAVD